MNPKISTAQRRNDILILSTLKTLKHDVQTNKNPYLIKILTINIKYINTKIQK